MHKITQPLTQNQNTHQKKGWKPSSFSLRWFLNELGLGNLWSLVEKVGDKFDPVKRAEKKEKANQLIWEQPTQFNGKFITTGKIIGDYLLPLSPDNTKFHMASFNGEANTFYERFVWNKYFNHLDFEKTFAKEITTFDKHFFTPSWTTWTPGSKKALVIHFWDWKLTNRTERGNIVTYDYIKNWAFAGKIVFYIFNNDELKPIDIITVKKESLQVRSQKDISFDYALLSRKPQILTQTLQEWWTFFYPYINFDINLYPIKNYLRELYYFFYYMTFSLFFRKNEELKNYYKSNIIDLHNIWTNLLDNLDIRNDIKWVIKNRDWYSLGQSLNQLIPWNFDVTYFYSFFSIKKEFYPCYLLINDVVEKKNTIEIHIQPKWWNIWLSHWLILDIFKRLNALEPKSFIYENLTSYNIKKDVSFMSYNQLHTIEDMIKGYQLINNAFKA